MSLKAGVVPFDGATVSSLQVCELVGISYRQINYWITSGLFPSIAPSGSGHPLRFSVVELLRAERISCLTHAGFTLEKIRELLLAMDAMAWGCAGDE